MPLSFENQMETKLGHYPTLDDILKAVRAMGTAGVVKYFPVEDAAKEIIVRELETMVPTKADLDWLVAEYIRKIGEWHSLKELRAVLCSRCKPLDGIPAISALPGYTPEEIAAANERAYFESQSAQTDRLLASRKQLAEPVDPVFEAEMKQKISEMNKRVGERSRESAVNFSSIVGELYT